MVNLHHHPQARQVNMSGTNTSEHIHVNNTVNIPSNDHSSLSGVFAVAIQTLQGFNHPNTPYTSYQPPGPYTTPAGLYTAQPCPFVLTSPSPPPPPPQFYDRLEKFMNDVNRKLTKLDVLDHLCLRMSNLEKFCNTVTSELEQVKRQLQCNQMEAAICSKHMEDIEGRMNKLQHDNRWLYDENCKLKKSVLDSQKRSMRDNLIVKGIPETDGHEENT